MLTLLSETHGPVLHLEQQWEFCQFERQPLVSIHFAACAIDSLRVVKDTLSRIRLNVLFIYSCLLILVIL